MSLLRGAWVGRPLPNRADLRSSDILDWIKQNVAASRKVLFLQALAFIPSATAGELASSSYVLPANEIAQVEEGFEVYAFGTCAANVNVKTVKSYLGGTGINGTSMYTSGAVAANGTPWTVGGTVVRNAAGGSVSYVEGRHNNALVSTIRTAMPAVSLAADQLISISLTAPTANADAVQEFMQIERIQTWNYNLGQ